LDRGRRRQPVRDRGRDTGPRPARGRAAHVLGDVHARGSGPFTTKARLYLDTDPVAQHEVAIQGVAVFVDAHGGGGCATGGAGSAGGVALALGAMLGLRRRRRAAVSAAAALALAPAAASADDIVLSVFDPVPSTTSNGFQLLSPDVGKSGDWVASAV